MRTVGLKVLKKHTLRILDALHLATVEYLRSRSSAVALASYDTRLTAAAVPLAAL